MERERARVRDRFSTVRDSSSGFRRRLPRYGKHFIGQATTYFFYDFLVNHSAKDLWYSFWSFGKVADVYIIERRDRRGRRFGFVRMSEASDEGESLNHVLEKKVAGLETKGAMSKGLAVIPVSIPDQASTSTANDANTYVSKEVVLQFSPREDEVAWLRQSRVALTITPMVDGKSFLIKVSKEEWRMDPDWWLVGERKSSGTSLDVSDMESDNSDDRYSEGDDRAVMAEDCAKTEAESELSLKQNVVQNFELSGLEMDGLGNVGSVGPKDCEVEELGVENGSHEGLMPAGAQQKGVAMLVKKCKKLGDIYAGDGVAEETRETGL
ncbi:hypothetical protein SLEP1_g55604 [Rubroshorea leprosula]|uniref:RRM domain-containing protein n=1 Tax=Rubroshorea leprosula TaxID=152421 RepID=A0AAV5MH18_9ROSI|nr:hypothetical protein SLEP1_g55604 [Rubroshorea leprosula]